MTREPVEDEDEPEDFTPLGTVPEPIELLPPEAARSGYLVYRAKDGFEAAVPISVMERCVAWGLRAEPNEWFGLVVGKLCEHGGQSHVVVLGAVPDPDAKARPNAVETTPESEFKTRTSAKLLYPDGIVLGWVHGHIRHGVSFSPTDLATQRTWTQPHSLGIVVDPWTPERLSVYRGPKAERLKLTRASSSRDFAKPGMPSLAERLRTAIACAARRRGRAIAWLAVMALLGLGAWNVDACLTALEGEVTPSVGAVAPDVVAELQDRVVALDEANSRVVPAVLLCLTMQCRLILDNPELVKEPALRERLTRSCAVALWEAAEPADHAGVCTPIDVSLDGDP